MRSNLGLLDIPVTNSLLTNIEKVFCDLLLFPETQSPANSIHIQVTTLLYISPDVFFIKHRHEVQIPRLVSQSGCPLSYLIYIPSVTSVLSQYSQAFHDIPLLSGTIYTPF